MTRRLITLIVLAALLGAIAGLHACSFKMTEKAELAAAAHPSTAPGSPSEGAGRSAPNRWPTNSTSSRTRGRGGPR
jgi:hypothetical protein